MTAAFDFIIVGAGSAGCVMAERLSRDPGTSVLVIEAGNKDRSPLITMPKGIAKLASDPAHTWMYRVAQPRLPGTANDEVWVRGRVLGGSSSINGMIWSRGQPADYDAWEALGATGWNWTAMKAAFRAIEDHALGDDGVRGSGGPVRVTPGTYRYPLAEALIRAGEQMGLARHDEDLNREDLEGVGYYAHNIHKGRRQSAARTFLATALKRPNVTVMTGTLAQAIAFDGKRANGLKVRTAAGEQVIGCRREVIVSGGTLESPRLLQLSGIGDGNRLRALGISVVAHSPDVGMRMREHLILSMTYRVTDGSINGAYRGAGLIGNLLRYYLTRGGPMAIGPFEVGVFARSRRGINHPDLQLFAGGVTLGREDGRVVVGREPGMTLAAQLSQLTSEGSVLLASPDPQLPAVITPNWLSTPEDKDAAVGATAFIRRFISRPAIADKVVHEITPGASVQSREDILEAWRSLATCGLHATGTCRMGSDADAVVDPHCRVRGVQGVRVIDCSIMPGLITGNTNAPAMATAWRLADLMAATN